MQQVNRNPIARNAWKFNKPKVIKDRRRKLEERDWKSYRNRQVMEY